MTKVVVLTGAGISAESGLPTFSGADGLWEGHRRQDVATPDGFVADPVTVQRFYNRLRRRLHEVEPNAAHHALARLQHHLGPRMRLVTQNIDDLHQRACTVELTAMHGELRKIRHVDTGQVLDWSHDVVETDTQWRPHVVWFGEPLPDGAWQQSVDAVVSADLVVVVGTSSVVYPAAGLPELAVANGTPVIEVNPEPTPLSASATVSLREKAATALPGLLQRLPALLN